MPAYGDRLTLPLRACPTDVGYETATVSAPMGTAPSLSLGWKPQVGSHNDRRKTDLQATRFRFAIRARRGRYDRRDGIAPRNAANPEESHIAHGDRAAREACCTEGGERRKNRYSRFCVSKGSRRRLRACPAAGIPGGITDVAGSERGCQMRCWLLFHRELEPDAPEAYEVLRFQEVAKKSGIDLQVLQPREFDLLVDSTDNWSTMYQDKKLDKPDLIIPRTGSETSYFTLAVLRHFERQGVSMVNRPAAIEAVADKLHTLQILAGAGLPVPKTILGKFPVDVDLVERELGFPVVVKTLKGTRGEGVLLCSNREQFNDLASLLDGAKPGADFIFQQYIRRVTAATFGCWSSTARRWPRWSAVPPTADSRQTYRSAGWRRASNYPSRWLISPSARRMSWGSMSRASTSCSTRRAIGSARRIRRRVSRGWRRPAR